MYLKRTFILLSITVLSVVIAVMVILRPSESTIRENVIAATADYQQTLEQFFYSNMHVFEEMEILSETCGIDTFIIWRVDESNSTLTYSFDEAGIVKVSPEDFYQRSSDLYTYSEQLKDINHFPFSSIAKRGSTIIFSIDPLYDDRYSGWAVQMQIIKNSPNEYDYYEELDKGWYLARTVYAPT